MKKTAREYAPSLERGYRKLNVWLRLAPSIRHGLSEIARNDNESINWVIEQVLIDYFHLEEPKYKVKKNGK